MYPPTTPPTTPPQFNNQSNPNNPELLIKALNYIKNTPHISIANQTIDKIQQTNTYTKEIESIYKFEMSQSIIGKPINYRLYIVEYNSEFSNKYKLGVSFGEINNPIDIKIPSYLKNVGINSLSYFNSKVTLSSIDTYMDVNYYIQNLYQAIVNKTVEPTDKAFIIIENHYLKSLKYLYNNLKYTKNTDITLDSLKYSINELHAIIKQHSLELNIYGKIDIQVQVLEDIKNSLFLITENGRIGINHELYKTYEKQCEHTIKRIQQFNKTQKQQ